MPDEVRLREGVPGRLTCRPSSDSQPVIRWQRNGQDVTEGDRLEMRDGGRMLVSAGLMMEGELDRELYAV